MVHAEFYDRRDQPQGVVTVPASIVATFLFGPCPEGMVWYIESINFHITNAHTGVIKMYADNGQLPDPLDNGRQWFSGAAATDGNNDFTSPRVVIPGQFLIVQATAGSGSLAANDQVSISLQRAWCDLNPTAGWGQLSGREKQSLMEMDEVEEMRRNASAVVGGSGWEHMQSVNPDDIYANAFTPWTDTVSTGDMPGEYEIAPGIGKYVGGDNLGPEHPSSPYDGRILPDGTTDSTS
jgi:hypothetical protein